jgi:uncharacterized protein (TIGR02145 family)
MKKLFVFIALSSIMISCSKEPDKPIINNKITCENNPNINFTSIGTPIGKFGECIKDIDGNTYKTVSIGTQTWMAENLKVSKYNDGTTIPNITDNSQWINNTTGAWTYYNNDVANNAKYGKFYNWYAVSKTSNIYTINKNVCPSGWHVPTDAEWTVLTDYLGGDSIAGDKMKEVGTISWNNPNTWDSPYTDATNTSLFTALPGGVSDFGDDTSNEMGIIGCWWSSTERSQAGAWIRILDLSQAGAYRDGIDKREGLSVRCIKD